MNPNPPAISLPLTPAVIRSLRAGQMLELSGSMLVGRDAAHQRLVESIKTQSIPPVPLNNQTIFYMGPTPAPPGHCIGSAGPTTSSRMDPMTLPLLEAGLRGMIGKGRRSPEVTAAIRQWQAVYFVAIGGIAALLSRHIVDYRVILYPELGPEALAEIQVRHFPVLVAIDCGGNSVYPDFPVT
ncbi:MAG: fumarate hydratase C-terminal domain-containing protein [Candidatus Delongbacteria bacterium]|nr:fumarate hydratase C-terminal domain-containing protein [Candidatus Delongbacteria bacterium]